MKKSIFFLSLLGLAAVACNNAAPAADENADAAAVSEMKASDFVPSKAEVDSVSYLLGVNFGSFLKAYNFGEDLNFKEMIKGMKDFVAAEGDMRSPEFAEQLLGYPLENALFNNGGYIWLATSIFSDGIGPLPESMAPYQNDELILHEVLGDCWSPNGTWSLSEDLRAKSAAALEESFVLPSPATFDEDGTYTYDADATAATKEQLGLLMTHVGGGKEGAQDA